MNLDLEDLVARNRDNISRTASYLELFGFARELPWVLMAHLVSRNTGYMLGELASRIEQRRKKGDDASAEAMERLALLLERGNYVIFDDAWRHVIAHLRRRRGLPGLPGSGTTKFMTAAWERYEREGGERQLVLDLVRNEQNVIERRVVHNERFGPGLRMLQLVEMAGREQPLHFPHEGVPEIRVGGFSELDLRIEAGRRIFDEVVGPHRDALYAWALQHEHTGSRAAYGGPETPKVRDVWPPERFEAMDPHIHAPLEDDPLFP